MNIFNFNEFIEQKQLVFNDMQKELRNALDDVSNSILNRMVSNDVYVVDKIEDDVLVCENLFTKEMISIDKTNVDKRVKEGDCIIKQEDKYSFSEKLTYDRKNHIQKKARRVFE